MAFGCSVLSSISLNRAEWAFSFPDVLYTLAFASRVPEFLRLRSTLPVSGHGERALNLGNRAAEDP